MANATVRLLMVDADFHEGDHFYYDGHHSDYYNDDTSAAATAATAGK